jgi:hypothetical protein
MVFGLLIQKNVNMPQQRNNLPANTIRNTSAGTGKTSVKTPTQVMRGRIRFGAGLSICVLKIKAVSLIACMAGRSVLQIGFMSLGKTLPL